MNGKISLKAALSLAVLALAVLAGIAVWLDTEPIQDGNRNPVPEIAASAGAIYATKVVDAAGNEQMLGRWSGKLLVINFWATWCAPCREEMPMLDRLQKTHGPNGLQIVGIAADSRSNVDNFAKSTKLSYPLFADENGAIELSKRLGNRFGLLPFTAVIRPGGEVLMVQTGIINEAQMSAIASKYKEK